ncbi:hypothetical protein [Ramlibacter sp.]|uniref:hypothetical protein n=1 Tax=Ramlibacter sp. TaxID=1917967 RepID=UPI003D0F0336
MNLNRRNRAPRAQDGAARTPTGRDEGTNATRKRPDPSAEPIPDGEHKYVPRSPYRTGNH